MSRPVPTESVLVRLATLWRKLNDEGAYVRANTVALAINEIERCEEIARSDRALEALARAYDREDSAQRGEPDPWSISSMSDEERAERLCCANAGIEAYFAALITDQALPTPDGQ